MLVVGRSCHPLDCRIHRRRGKSLQGEEEGPQSFLVAGPRSLVAQGHSYRRLAVRIHTEPEGSRLVVVVLWTWSWSSCPWSLSLSSWA